MPPSSTILADVRWDDASVRSGVNARAIVGRLWLPACVLCVWAFSLSRSLFDPIGYDQGLYQYMAERVLRGDRLYVDMWDQNGPGIVLVHLLSTLVAGTSPLALRLFDTGWQLLTIVALMALALRGGRRWNVAWIAAGLYTLAYYSLGYVHTAQREGFAVLPMLLAVHLVIDGRRPAWSGTAPPCSCASARHAVTSQPLGGPFARYALAGVLHVFVFLIKPPLGLAFGALWLYQLLRCLCRRDAGRWFGLAGLTAGFVVASLLTCGTLACIGSWDGFWGVLTRRDMPGYVRGPRMIRDIVPTLLAGAAAMALIAASWHIFRPKVNRDWQSTLSRWALACGVFAAVVSAHAWPAWTHHVLLRFAGLSIPVAGAVLVHRSRFREESLRLSLLMLAAVTAAVILQGQFFLYHLPPMTAFAAYIAADEIVRCMRKADAAAPNSGLGEARFTWPTVCIVAVVYLAVCQWWPTMSFVTARPCVLAGTTLDDHYTSITKHKRSFPKHSTIVAVADRIRELTDKTDPIAALFHEARIYYFARRPSVHKLIAMQTPYAHLFGEYMQAIRDRRPKVIVARIPEPLRQSTDLPAIESAVFDEAERFFGEPGRTIRELYHVTETIDDVCILRPR